MTKRFWMLALLASATLAVAQDISTLNQSLALHTRFLNDQNGGIEGSYNFTTTMPVLGYGLGAMSLTGGVDYERVPTGSGTASALGLNSWGFGTSLFPTLPFHLSLDYTHSRTPDITGLGGAEGQTYGAGLSFKAPWLGDAHLSFRAGDMEMPTVSEQWHLWKFDSRERLGQTDTALNLVHQDYQSSGEGLSLSSSFLNASTDTKLSRGWSFHNQLSSSRSTGMGTDLDLSSDLIGQLGGGKGTSFTALTEQGLLTPAGNQWSTSLSQSLSWTFGKFSATGSLSRVGSLGLLPNSIADSGSASLGGAYMLGGGWSLAGDTSQTWGSGGFDSTSFHLGVAQGGEVSDLIKHSLFYFSDRQFNRRVTEDYPPGYVPPELKAELVQRRMAREGALRYSADFWHAQMNGNHASQDWARTSGELELFSSLRLLISGDWKRDDGFTTPGVMLITRGLNLSASYRFNWASASFSAGLGNSTSGLGRGADSLATEVSTTNQEPGHTATYLSAALQTQVWGIPMGGSLTEMTDAQGLRSTLLNSYTMVSYGKVQLRVGLQESWSTGSRPSRQITVDLVRWFDTIAFWAPWTRF